MLYHALHTKTKKVVILGMLAMIYVSIVMVNSASAIPSGIALGHIPFVKMRFVLHSLIGIKCLKSWQSQVESDSDVKCVEHGNTLAIL